MSLALTTALVVATLGAGLLAGFLGAFAHTVMPGLASADDRTYIRAFQTIDGAVENPWFLVPFSLTPFASAAALVLAIGADEDLGTSVLIAAALVLTLATAGITAVVHLPLNREIAGVTHDAADPLVGEARGRFERRWVRWNIVRTLVATAGFLCLLLTIVRAS